MLSTYRRVLAHPGTLRFSATGLVARLPISMVSLGIVLLVSEATGSYGLAGAVSAAFLLANAARRDPAGPAGRHASARGGCCPRPRSLCTAALVLLMVSVQADWPLVLDLRRGRARRALPAAGRRLRPRPLVATCSTSRRRCRPPTRWRRVLDEAVFILGPILVTVLATSLAPARGPRDRGRWPGCVGTLAFAAQRATAPPAAPAARRHRSAPRHAVAHDRAADRRVPDARGALRRRPRWPPSRSPTSWA